MPFSFCLVRICFSLSSIPSLWLETFILPLFLLYGQVLFNSMLFTLSQVVNCFILIAFPSLYGLNCFIPNFLPSLWLRAVLFQNLYLLYFRTVLFQTRFLIYGQELFYSKLCTSLKLGAILFPILSLLYGQKLIYSKRFTFSTWLLTVLFLTLSPLYCLEPLYP